VSKEIKSHKEILKSTSIIGGAQIGAILIGLLRTKALAVLLGPIGIGYIGVLQNIIDLARQTTSLGVNFSGIKDVAESNNSNDKTKIARIITILRKLAFWTGILGTLLTTIFCFPLSKYSFGDISHASSIAIVSVTILITSISAGQLAILQGLRKMGLMAKATFYGALLGTAITLPLYLLLGINGIVPGMILTSLSALFLSWWYTKDIRLDKVNLSFSDILKGGSKMARLGFFITITGIIATITLYVVRSFLLKKISIDAVGYFQACWIIATLYMGIILNAMLTDFFPRLTEVNKTNQTANRLINEQLEIAFLISSPMIVGIVAFAHLITSLLYSNEFIVAVPVLQWFISGTFFTIISWPLGVLFLAKNKGFFSFITESIWSIVFLAILYSGWEYFGFKLIGYAFVVAGAIRFISVYWCTVYLSNFRFSKVNLRYIVVFGSVVVLTLFNVTFSLGIIQYSISFILIIGVLSYSYVYLNKIVNINDFIRDRIRNKQSNL